MSNLNTQRELLRAGRDEELVARAQETDGSAAVNLILERHQEVVASQVACLARKAGCQAADIDDAQQLAVNEWLRVAIAKYDPSLGRPFLSFLAQVVDRRFANFLRECHRQARHTGGFITRDGLVVRSEHDPEPVADHRHDPAQLAEEAEAQARCEQALSLLTEKQQQLCELRRAGFALEEIARQMGLSPSTVQRWLGLAEKKLRLTLRCPA
jgi:RNA polymerase sigma factor (sigma-70 family)